MPVRRAAENREPFSWVALAKHVFSPRLLIVFAAVKALMWLVEKDPRVERATLPGVDIAMIAIGGDTAQRTAVIGITADDVDTLFKNTRPVPPQMLLSTVDGLARLKPAVLVVDVFTEDSAYAGAAIPTAVPIVWAQSVDTTSGALLRVLGGDTVRSHTTAIAAMLAEEDGLVRRVRLAFRRADDSSAPTLPRAAVDACRERPQSTGARGACRIAANVPSDTSSVALRLYERDPIFYSLGDALAAANAGDTTTFASSVVVFGFVDGSDQVATPYGIRPGPSVVADAIETLMDDRGVLRKPPLYLGIGLDLLGMLLVAALYFVLRHRPTEAALATLGMTVVAYFLARGITIKLNYWTSFLPVMIGVWVDQLADRIRKERKQDARADTSGEDEAQPSTPAAAAPPPPDAVQAEGASTIAAPTPSAVPTPPAPARLPEPTTTEPAVAGAPNHTAQHVESTRVDEAAPAKPSAS